MRKFISEFAVNMVGGPHALVQQEDLDHEVIQQGFADHPCHIYMICRRPRITIRPEDVKFTASTFEGYVTIQNGEELKKEPFAVPVPDATDLKFNSEYPFNEFSISNAKGETCLAGKAAVIAANFGSQFYEHLSVDVLYVGQAYGD